MPKYFDIHSHLNADDFKGDLDTVIDRMRESETYTIVVGTDLGSSERAVELADKYEGVYACVGIHPSETKKHVSLRNKSQFDPKKFERLIAHPKTVAVGECGLDFYREKKELTYERQRELFLDQVKFAMDHKKPLMIHGRDSYEEILETLESVETEPGQELRGNVHFFSGNVSQAERFLRLGFSISFTGVVTFSRDYDEVIRHVALERIMAETDAPYVAPVPHRGKRNEPSYVSEVVRKIAEVRGEDLEHVRETLVNNALRMIG